MCVVSAVIDRGLGWPQDQWTRPLWDQLKQDIVVAQEEDIINGNPDCESEEKLIKLGQLAQELGYEVIKIKK